MCRNRLTIFPSSTAKKQTYPKCVEVEAGVHYLLGMNEYTHKMSTQLHNTPISVNSNTGPEKTKIAYRLFESTHMEGIGKISRCKSNIILT